jgi:bifunctional enzyme CysN/CysC
VVAAGHVDHGKSTLVGRLLHDTASITPSQAGEIRAASERRGVAFEWSFLLDALQGERDQAVTIDTSRAWLRLPQAEIVLIDAPGHTEFIRNMVTGASEAEAALLVVDVQAGLSEQTRRHALLLQLLGLRVAVVAVNKMDLAGYEESRFRAVAAELASLLGRLGIEIHDTVPVCARSGENLAAQAASMPWYRGRTILEALLALQPAAPATAGPLRLPVQGVLRRDARRIIVGRIESGTLRPGDQIAIAPSGRVARVRSIERWPAGHGDMAEAGESIGIELDGPLFVDRGDAIVSADRQPLARRSFRVRLLWLAASPPAAGRRLTLRCGTRSASAIVKRIERTIDIQTLSAGREPARRNDVVEAVLESPELIALDASSAGTSLGRFILSDGLEVVGAGTVIETLEPALSAIVPAAHLVNADARAWRNNHRGAVIWLTGPPASGKSTLAMAAEQRLFERGYQVFVLDGDDIRGGLNRDLGFSRADRAENIRRAGEVAALFAQAGFVVIAAFVSPFTEDRARARAAAAGAFHEIYLQADSATREARDPKGHYRAARAGALPNFTGVDGSYEPPPQCELTIDTGERDVADATAALVGYIETAVRLAAPSAEANP